VKARTIQQAVSQLARLSPLRPKLAVVLGTGFGSILESVELEAELAYAKIPGFPPVGVRGHAGRVFMGRLGSTPLLVLSGRAHFYEGYTMAQITFPVRVLAAYGISDLLLTNAAGGIHRSLRTGDFMVLSDHINGMGDNPLRGPWPDPSARFVDMSCAYDPRLRTLLLQAAKACRVRARPGVYLAVSGPSFETPAEIRAFARWGADAVGMSTVPEAIVARQEGLRVAALSLITNCAGGHDDQACSHEGVLDAANQARGDAAKLLSHFVSLYGRPE
jgi:purine-nucleoside phosphorylase